jgi:CheY-like chemotaxis protein
MELLYAAEKSTVGRAPVTGAGTVSGRRRSEMPTILVVEDDPEVRDLVADLLEDLGYRTLVAASGAAALSLLRADRTIDVVFTDLVMPGPLDGLALAEEARRICPEIKIVFTSGFVAHPAMRNRLPSQDEILLHKPYRRVQLAAAIARALAR